MGSSPGRASLSVRAGAHVSPQAGLAGKGASAHSLVSIRQLLSRLCCLNACDLASWSPGTSASTLPAVHRWAS